MNRIANGLMVSGATLALVLAGASPTAGATVPTVPAAVAVPTAVAAPGLSATAPAPAGTGISVNAATPDPASPAYLTVRLPAGASVQDAVIVTNPSVTAVTVALTPVDGLTAPSSGTVYSDQATPSRQAGAWVTLALTTLTVPAGTSRRVAFTAAAPIGAEPGDHVAGIAVDDQVSTTSTSGAPVTETLRSIVGVRVVVAGAASFVPALTTVAINPVGAARIGTVMVGLGNAGRQLGEPQLTVALAGPAGYQRTLTRQLGTVLAGDTISYPFAWPDRLASGNYTVTTTLSGGGISATHSQPVHLAAALAGTAQALEPAGLLGHAWWQWLLIALAATVLLAAGYALRRRRAAVPAVVTVVPARVPVAAGRAAVAARRGRRLSLPADRSRFRVPHARLGFGSIPAPARRNGLHRRHREVDSGMSIMVAAAPNREARR